MRVASDPGLTEDDQVNVDTEVVLARLVGLERESATLNDGSNAADRYGVIVAELAATVRALTRIIDEGPQRD